jgi:hypothetical protein
MINDLRKLLQTRLSAIEGLSSGRAKADDVIEENEIYYGYELTYSVEGSDQGYDYNEYNITLTGRLVSKNKSIAVMDAMANEIAKVLLDLRFKYTIQDVTQYDKINKLIINGRTNMNTIDYKLR